MEEKEEKKETIFDEVQNVGNDNVSLAVNPKALTREGVESIKKVLDRIVELKENKTTLSSDDYFEKKQYVPESEVQSPISVKRIRRKEIPKCQKDDKPKSDNKPVLGDRTKVAIVGFADTTRMMAPYNDPSFEIWGLNELYMIIPRADRWFEIHCDHNIRHSFREPGHWEWLKKCKIPVYMPKKYKEIPTSVEWPKVLMEKMFGKIFSSSIAEMYATAIYEGFETIEMYGVDMALTKEYGAQKSSVEYLVGLATGMGIKTYIPPESDILKVGFCYGYDDPNEFAIKMKEKNVELIKKINGATEAERNAHDAKLRLEGAKQLNDYYTENFVKVSYNAKYKDK